MSNRPPPVTFSEGGKAETMVTCVNCGERIHGASGDDPWLHYRTRSAICRENHGRAYPREIEADNGRRRYRRMA